MSPHHATGETDAIRLGAGAGFWGDALDPALDLLKEGALDYLCFDFLAELTMALLQRQKARNPDSGYVPEELEAAIGPRTRLIPLNSPHNPTGKVYSRAELEHVAELAIRHDLLVVTDEVYEHIVYEGEHIPLATLPGMRDRTVTISSGGKTFSTTGWKIGWVCATPELVTAVRTSKQFLTYVSGGPFQYAIAEGLNLGDDYFRSLADGLRERRDRLSAGLAGAGFDVWNSAGTYFVTTHLAPMGYSDGVAFCWSLPERCGVVAVPSVVFYDSKDVGRPLVRFACCKRPEVIAEAAERLATLQPDTSGVRR